MPQEKTKPKVIQAYKTEIIKINNLKDLWQGNILEIDHGKKELIVDIKGMGVEHDKWPTSIYTVSRSCSKTGCPTIVHKAYSPLAKIDENFKKLGIGSIFQEGVYLRDWFEKQGDEGWLISKSPGAKDYDKQLRKVEM